MGKTQRLLDYMIECVAEGQPKCVVVCASYQHVMYMMERVKDTLTRNAMNFTTTRNRLAIFVDGSEIEFISCGEIDLWRLCHRGYGEFWTEYGEYIYDMVNSEENSA